MGPFTAVSGHPSCNHPADPCQRGECDSKLCKDIDNQSGFSSSCPTDNEKCTVDCLPDTSTSFGLDVRCRQADPNPSDFNLPTNTPCSIPNGTDKCDTGTCQTGSCQPDGGTNNCTGTGTLQVCERWECVSGGSCVIQPMDPGTVCEKPLKCEDCHDKVCVIDGLGKGKCRDHGRALDGNLCDGGDGNLCTRGQCNGSFECKQVVTLGDLHACPIPPNPNTCAPGQDADDNICTLDFCLGGTCSHHPTDDTKNGQPCKSDNNSCTLDFCDATGSGQCTHPADPSQNGAPCMNRNTCAATSACSNGVCTGVTCNTTGTCYNCGGYPPCSDDPPSCGCNF